MLFDALDIGYTFCEELSNQFLLATFLHSYPRFYTQWLMLYNLFGRNIDFPKIKNLKEFVLMSEPAQKC